MSGEDEAVSTYAYFRDEVLPRIKKQGYTAIQLMAIQVRFEPGTFGGNSVQCRAEKGHQQQWRRGFHITA
jgi:hypothetical protein